MKCTNGFIVYGIVIMLGIIYGRILKWTGKDILNNKIFNLNMFNENCCSWWPVTHFILYLILGIVSPECYLLWIFIGIMWEIIEYYIGFLDNKNKLDSEKKSNNQYNDKWWTGSINDILFNILGLFIGIGINKIMKNR